MFGDDNKIWNGSKGRGRRAIWRCSIPRRVKRSPSLRRLIGSAMQARLDRSLQLPQLRFSNRHEAQSLVVCSSTPPISTLDKTCCTFSQHLKMPVVPAGAQRRGPSWVDKSMTCATTRVKKHMLIMHSDHGCSHGWKYVLIPSNLIA